MLYKEMFCNNFDDVCVENLWIIIILSQIQNINEFTDMLSPHVISLLILFCTKKTVFRFSTDRRFRIYIQCARYYIFV